MKVCDNITTYINLITDLHADYYDNLRQKAFSETCTSNAPLAISFNKTRKT